jgi:membrane protein YqaA with SNARE-associated domain
MASASLRTTAMPYLTLFLVVLGINLLPAFGPPTWAVLVFARIHWHLSPVALVVIGGIGAMLGRYLLARGALRFRGHLKPQRRENLTAVSNALLKRRSSAMASLGVFAISPLPSAQLFVAAGLLELDLIPLTLAFFVGRLVSYSIYIAVATVAEHQLGSVLAHLLGSPWSITLQVVLLAAVAVLPFINWKGVLERRSKQGGGISPPG